MNQINRLNYINSISSGRSDSASVSPQERAAGAIAMAFTESNREGFGCEHYLISQAIDPGYKAYLMYNLLINI